MLDKHKTAQFTRFEGDRAAQLDHKLGVDYQLYNALNMQAQRATLKALDAQRRINSTIPNRGSGLGKVDAQNKKLTGKSFNSNLDMSGAISSPQGAETRASFGMSTE